MAVRFIKREEPNDKGDKLSVIESDSVQDKRPI